MEEETILNIEIQKWLNSELYNAIIEKDIHMIESLLIDNADANIVYRDMTPLAYAIVQKNIELVKLLLDHGADPNFTTDGRVISPPLIRSAAKNGYIEITKLLIERGANVNIIDNFGKTALMYAAKSRNSEMTKLLLQNGANMHISDNNGDTTLMYAQTAVIYYQTAVKRGDVSLNCINIFCTLSNIFHRKEIVIYLGAIWHTKSKSSAANKITQFLQISANARRDWKMDISSFLSAAIPN